MGAIQTAINKKRHGLEQALKRYVVKFTNLLEWLIDQHSKADSPVLRGALYDIVRIIISTDVEFIARHRDFIGGEKSIAIALDFSPLRITLALLPNEELSVSRVFYPPIYPLLTAPKFMKPYRTLDGHPIMARVPTFNVADEQLRQDVEETNRVFRDEVRSLIEAVKGLAGKREIAPRLIKEKLVEIMYAYLSYNPMSVDNLKVMDLGCGTGELLRDVYGGLLKDVNIARQIHIQTLLNDVHEDLGKIIRNIPIQEEFFGIFEFQMSRNDMINLIQGAWKEHKQYNIAFINRVFDLYGGYGAFTFPLKEVVKEIGSISSKKWHTTSDATEFTPINPQAGGKVVAYTGAISHEKVWRALRPHLAWPVERGNWVFLPGVEMNVIKNFFGRAEGGGLACLLKLLDITELLVISVFPESFQTLFPIEWHEPISTEIFHCHVPMPPTSRKVYSIICVSKNKQLIKYLEKYFGSSILRQ